MSESVIEIPNTPLAGAKVTIIIGNQILPLTVYSLMFRSFNHFRALYLLVLSLTWDKHAQSITLMSKSCLLNQFRVFSLSQLPPLITILISLKTPILTNNL